jgi:hypothetical protein
MVWCSNTIQPRPRDIPTKQQNISSQVDNFAGREHRTLLLLYTRRFGFDFDTFLEHSEARLLVQYVN